MTRRGSLQGRGYRSRGKVGSESPRFAQGPCTKASRPKDRGHRSGVNSVFGAGKKTCDAEVSDSRTGRVQTAAGLAVDEDVRWLEVKVEKSGLMFGIAASAIVAINNAESRGGIGPQPSLERPSGDVFEHEVVPGANLADVVKDDYAGMPHQRKRLCLLVPAFSWLLVGSLAAGITLSTTWRPRASCRAGKPLPWSPDPVLPESQNRESGDSPTTGRGQGGEFMGVGHSHASRSSRV